MIVCFIVKRERQHWHLLRVPWTWTRIRQLFAFVSRGTFLAVDAKATSLLESLETSLAGVRTARKRLRLEIGKFSATEEATIDQRYKEEVYSGKCVHNRMERGWVCLWVHLISL